MSSYRGVQHLQNCWRQRSAGIPSSAVDLPIWGILSPVIACCVHKSGAASACLTQNVLACCQLALQCMQLDLRARHAYKVHLACWA